MEKKEEIYMLNFIKWLKDAIRLTEDERDDVACLSQVDGITKTRRRMKCQNLIRLKRRLTCLYTTRARLHTKYSGIDKSYDHIVFIRGLDPISPEVREVLSEQVLDAVEFARSQKTNDLFNLDMRVSDVIHDNKYLKHIYHKAS